MTYTPDLLYESTLPTQRCATCQHELATGAVCPECDAPAADGRLGQVLGGKYRLEGLLGVGGWGRVYRGLHLRLGEEVAVKFLSPDLTFKADYRERFRREAVALARLRHPGIVSLHDFGEEAGEIYMVMELIRGVVLARRVLVDGRTLPVEQVVDIVGQVLQVLEAAHAAGIIHRDLKPENIMLLDAGDRTRRVKVLDFGLALLSDAPNSARLTAAQIVHGTPLYMAPEQCRGEDLGPASDIYALGVMFFELLAGAPPFTAALSSDVMVRHMYIEPPPIAQCGVHQAAPPELEALVRWALAKRPGDRPTAAQLRDALLQAQAGQGPVQQRERAAAERARVGYLDRDERALRMDAAPTAPLEPPPRPAPGEEPVVVLWGLGRGAEALRDALAVHGVYPVLAGGELPPAEVDGRAVTAVLLLGDAAAAERVRRVRADFRLCRVPVLAVDVPAATETPALIRAGVSDVAPRGAAADAVCQRVWRLIRRGR